MVFHTFANPRLSIMSVVTFAYSTNSFQEASATDPVESAVLPKIDSPITQLILALGEGSRTIYRLYSSGEALYPFAKQALESHLPQVRDAFIPRGKTAVWAVEFDPPSFSQAEELHRWCLPDWSMTIVCSEPIESLENLLALQLLELNGLSPADDLDYLSWLPPNTIAVVTHEEAGDRDQVRGWCEAVTFKHLPRGALADLISRGVSFSL